MLQARSETLHTLFSVLHSCNPEVVLGFSSSGLRVFSMDRAGTTAYFLSAKKEAFDRYDYKGNRAVVNTANFLSILRQGKGSQATLYLDKEKATLSLKGNLEKRYTIPLIAEPEEEKKPDLSKMEWDCELEQDNSLLYEAVTSLADKEAFLLTSEENRLVVCDRDHMISSKVEIPSPTYRRYKLTNVRLSHKLFLMAVEQHKALATESTYFLKSDYPVKIVTSSEGNVTVPEGIQLTTVTAPRVRNE
jgi:hypothetical protein